MLQQNLYWTQHEFSFGVWEQDKCTGLLRIIPLGCAMGEQREDPDAPRYTAYGIYVQIKIEKDGFECTGFDFISPSRFRELLQLLKGFEHPAPVKAHLIGDEGGVDIQFERRGEDIIVSGQIPAKGYADSYFAENPLELRSFIKTIVDFEFLIELEKLHDSCAELEKLLKYIRSVEESHSR